MSDEQLLAVSPIDGRYSKKVEHLRAIFSESALMRYRVITEITWLEYLSECEQLGQIPPMTSEVSNGLKKIQSDFGIEGLQIHNRRGDDTLGHFGMASATAKLSRGTSSASGNDGLSVHDVEFRADIDMPVFKMGGTSIGSVQFTDFAIINTTMMVYGH